MSEVKWIKITTDIFDDEKILLIESMPESDSMIVIWFKLLAFAGKANNNGVFMLSEKIPYTDEMFATIFRRPLNTIRLALQTFERFGMIETIDGVITIPNWEKHQNIDGLDKIREQTRKRVAKYRAKQKQKLLVSPDVSDDENNNVTITFRNAIEEDKEEEEDKEKEKRIDYQLIADMYNETCVSFPRLRSLSDSRKKAIKARLNGGYTVDDFKELFKAAEASTFLKGSNNRNWSATFDWLIKDGNMAKVLDGNYTDKKKADPKPVDPMKAIHTEEDYKTDDWDFWEQVRNSGKRDT